MKHLVLPALAVLFPSLALACAFDTDCEPGSTCLKAPNAAYGMCSRGIPPDNRHGWEPDHAPQERNRSYGTPPCSFDMDCEWGSKCIKSGNAAYGVCAGGLPPGSRRHHQQPPTYLPPDSNETPDSSCTADTDCAPDSECIKAVGAIYGVCTRGR